MVVLVDAKYFGNMLRVSRRRQSIKTNDLAKKFRISVRQWRRYENGQDPIPENILMSLFQQGMCMIQCKCCG